MFGTAPHHLASLPQPVQRLCSMQAAHHRLPVQECWQIVMVVGVVQVMMWMVSGWGSRWIQQAYRVAAPFIVALLFTCDPITAEHVRFSFSLKTHVLRHAVHASWNRMLHGNAHHTAGIKHRMGLTITQDLMSIDEDLQIGQLDP